MSQSRRDFGQVKRRAGRPGYYVVFHAEGREIMRNAGPTRAHATRKLAAIESLLAEGAGLDETLGRIFNEVTGSTLTLREAAPMFLEAVGPRLKPSTHKGHSDKFDFMLRESWGGKNLSAVTSADLEKWCDARLKAGTSGASMNRYLSVLSTFFKWAERRSLVEGNPVRRIPRFSEAGRERQLYLEPAEVRALVNAAEDWFKPFLVVAVSTGARRGELLGLTWGAVDLSRRSLVIVAKTAKTSRAREIPLTPDAHAVLSNLRATSPAPLDETTSPILRQRDGRPLTGEAVKRALKRAVRGAGDAIPAEKRGHIGTHVLRHTTGTLLAMKGTPILDISRVLGHSDVRVTARHYAHAHPSNALRAIQGLSEVLNLSPGSDGATESKAV
ncbi:MAG: site-specific integrase [Planctomycetota bacterium]